MKKLFAGVICSALLLTSALAAEPGLLISPTPLISGQSAYTVTVDDSALDLTGKAPYLENGKRMVPLRAVAEALGYTITWTAEKPDAVEIDNGTVHTWVYIGLDSYSRTSSTALGMGAPQSFGAAPAAINSTTFVPVDLFTMLGDVVVMDENGVTLTPAADSGRVEIPNPLVAYETVEEAQAAAGVVFTLPAVPEGYVRDGVSVIAGSTVQVTFAHGDERITFRAALGSGDISGDFNVYAETKTVAVGEIQVTMKGGDGKVSAAVWQDGGRTCSLHLTQAMDEAAVAAMIAG